MKDSFNWFSSVIKFLFVCFLVPVCVCLLLFFKGFFCFVFVFLTLKGKLVKSNKLALLLKRKSLLLLRFSLYPESRFNVYCLSATTLDCLKGNALADQYRNHLSFNLEKHWPLWHCKTP